MISVQTLVYFLDVEVVLVFPSIHYVSWHLVGNAWHHVCFLGMLWCSLCSSSHPNKCRWMSPQRQPSRIQSCSGSRCSFWLPCVWLLYINYYREVFCFLYWLWRMPVVCQVWPLLCENLSVRLCAFVRSGIVVIFLDDWLTCLDLNFYSFYLIDVSVIAHHRSEVH